MHNLKIRFANKNDIDIIVLFNKAMGLETEGITLDENILKNGVENVLGDSSKGFYILAELDKIIVGQSMVTYEWSDWRNSFFYWIQSVYVRPEYRNQGIFRSLFNFIKEVATNNSNICGLRLYVDKNNQNAISVYKNLGMLHSHYLMFEMEIKK